MFKWICLFMAFNLNATVLLHENTYNEDDQFEISVKATEKLKFNTRELLEMRSNKLKLKLSFVVKKNNGEHFIVPLKVTLQEVRSLGSYSYLEEVDGTYSCIENEKYIVQAKLKGQYIKINSKSRRTYYLKEEVVCSKNNIFTYNEDTLSGGALSIWSISHKITSKLKNNDLIKFWKKNLKITYPGRGDYYNIFGVNLTVGHHWDVVGHEIGHAVYAMANIGISGNGQHSIDQCYSNELALSEGWASFFSAWVSIDLKDNDAKFEFMVPRRAPLGVEHIPFDVCRGENNEWRVFGFLWDLIDLNNDNVHFNLSFKELWKLMKIQNLTKISDVKNRLLDNGFDPILVNILWEHNIFNNELKSSY